MILHKIHVKLYPNFLKNGGGAYIARTNNKKTLYIEDVCSAMKTRAGYSGNYETLVQNVRQFYDEVAYQLCDGNAVSNGYYSVYPNIGGTFDSAAEAHDHQKHAISFRFSPRAKLRELVRHIAVEVEGIAGHAPNRAETRSQYAGGNDKLLKKTRTISSSFIAEAG